MFTRQVAATTLASEILILALTMMASFTFSRARRINLLLGTILGGVLGCAALTQTASALDLTLPTTSWKAITYANNNADPFNDEQTGDTESDIVGTVSTPAAYTLFDPGTAASLTDGELAFRVRIGAEKNPAGYARVMLVGIDANNDGKLDVFAIADKGGNIAQNSIYKAGTGLNTSPNTTTAVPFTPALSYAHTASNFNYMPVTLTNSPGASSIDLDADGNNDYFVSFSVDFAALVSSLSNVGITGVNQNTKFNYVIGSSTQDNAFNQDISGIGQWTNQTGNQTFTSTGAFATPTSAADGIPAPEPTTAWMAMLLVGVAGGRRWRSQS